MPPRIRLPSSLPGSFVTRTSTRPILPFLAPALQTRSRPLSDHASSSSPILSSLKANPGEHHRRIRRGRGASSGHGKTSGRGHKGQKQHGKVPFGFEGGQTPLHIVHGERGFVNVHSIELNTVPLSRIYSWIAQGRIDPTKPITVRELALSGCVNRIKDGVKLLANSFTYDASVAEVPTTPQPLTIIVSRASKEAIAAVEKAGGTVLTRYYTKWAIEKIIKGQMDPINSLQSISPPGVTPQEKQQQALSGDQATEKVSQAPVGAWANPALRRGQFAYRLPDATGRKDIEYYRDPAHRGYLSYQLKEGQNPSLLFKDVATESNFGKFASAKKGKAGKRDHGRLW